MVANTTSLNNLFQVSQWPHFKKSIPYVKSKSNLFDFQSIAFCSDATGPAKKPLSFFLYKTLLYWKAAMRYSPELSLLWAK